jgi:hypothetical protein
VVAAVIAFLAFVLVGLAVIGYVLHGWVQR